jgi:hypothetical protein
MYEQAFTITIKPAEESQLEVLEHEFSPETLSKHHYKRYEVQKQGKEFTSSPGMSTSLSVTSCCGGAVLMMGVSCPV